MRAGAGAEAELLLSEARDRAEQILQDSMQRANDLLARERIPAAPGAESAPPADLEPIRRSVDELTRGMRDVLVRLDRIEAMLVSQPAAPAAPPAPVMAAPVRPAPPPVEDERRPGVLSVVTPQSAPPPPPSVLPPTQQPPSMPAPAVRAPMPPPPSAMPPMRIAQPAAMAQPAPTYEPAPEPAPAPEELSAAAARRGEHEDEVPGTLATFTPSDGSVLLRAAPVSGFQGLMRLQDALQRIPAVRQATVEAYSQGEARLRLELASDVDSDEIAEGIGAGLGQTAQVRAASETERNIIIAFG